MLLKSLLLCFWPTSCQSSCFKKVDCSPVSQLLPSTRETKIKLLTSNFSLVYPLDVVAILEKVIPTSLSNKSLSSGEGKCVICAHHWIVGVKDQLNIHTVRCVFKLIGFHVWQGTEKYLPELHSNTPGLLEGNLKDIPYMGSKSREVSGGCKEQTCKSWMQVNCKSFSYGSSYRVTSDFIQSGFLVFIQCV